MGVGDVKLIEHSSRFSQLSISRWAGFVGWFNVWGVWFWFCGGVGAGWCF